MPHLFIAVASLIVKYGLKGPGISVLGDGELYTAAPPSLAITKLLWLIDVLTSGHVGTFCFGRTCVSCIGSGIL